MKELPLVTVIMPVRNEGAYMARSLLAVLDQDYPDDLLEVIVADGMSTDGTRQLVRSLQARHSNLRLIDNTGQIVPMGLNAAIPQARGKIIIRVDGHTIVEPDYVRECVAALGRSGADNVGGRMDAVSDGMFGQAVALATSSRFGVGGARFHYSDREEWVDTVYMGAWPRGVFERIGLFDEEQIRNQDDEFNYRLRSRGGRILLSPRIKSSYYNRSTLRSLWRQYFQYGYWKVRVLQKHPRQMKTRQFVPAIFVSALFASIVSALIFPKAGWIFLAAVAGAYIAANACASIVIAGWRNVRMLLRLPAVFFVLHIAYGSGFLFGLVRFWNRWRADESGPQRWSVVEEASFERSQSSALQMK